MLVRKILSAVASSGTTSSVVSVASDAYYDKVTLLLTGDTDVDTSFSSVALLLPGNDLLDKSLSPVTLTNTTVTVSNATKKYGTGSLYFNGSSYLSLSLSTTAAFTFECWFYRTAAVVGGNYNFFIGTSGTGIAFYNAGTTIRVGSSSFTVPDLINQWVHIAVTRDASNNVRVFFNGVESSTGSLVESGTYSWTRIGAYNATYTFQGYMDDIRLTNGVVRYTSNFTPSVQALPTHTILDSSVYRLPVSTYGNTRIDTTTKKFGTGSMYFDGSGDYLSLPSTTTGFSGDFTVEGWCYYSNVSGYATIFDARVAGTYSGILLYVNVGTSSINVTVGSSTVIITGANPAANTWFHFALSRSGSSVYLFVNGIQIGTTATNSTSFPSNILYLGAFCDPSANLNGYIDDFRITKGYARYTSNFTPPTAALPTIPPTIAADPWWGNVSLLLDGNTTDTYDPNWQNVSLMLTGNDFIDWSNQHSTVTNTGTVTLSTAIKKYGTSSISTNGNYLTTSTNSNLIFNGDFTVEAWVYINAYGMGPLLAVGLYNNGIWLRSSDQTVCCINGTFFTLSGTYTTNFPLTTWIHVAITRAGSTARLFINGQLNSTLTGATGTVNSTGAGAQLGLSPHAAGEYFNGYTSDFRVTKGIARYTANFTPPTVALPAFKIQDRTQNNLTLTPYGNVQLSTDVKKNGTGSMFFDGTGDYLSTTDYANTAFGTGDFTIECWVYIPSPATSQILFATGATGLWFGIKTSKIWFSDFGGASQQLTTGTIAANTWTHIAISRNSGVLNGFINGVNSLSVSYTTSFGASFCYVGAYDSSASYATNGYIDDLRVTKGYARYTQNFTPPSQSFATQYISTGFDPNYANVTLLLTGEGTNGSTTFTDLSSTPKTITNNGASIATSTSVKKYGTGSINFPGNIDNSLTIPASTDYVFDTGNFTIEFWLNTTDTGSYRGTVNDNSYHTVSNNFLLMLNYPTTGKLTFWMGNGTVCCSSASTVNTGNWVHIAMVRESTTSVKMYINGVVDTSATIAAATTFGAGTGLIIGNQNGFTNGRQFVGYLDDIRITKGIARYTANFTPPTYQLPTDTAGTVIDSLRASTSLLLRGNGTNGSNTFTDESPNGLTVTNTGSVTVNTTTKKYGTGSMAFSGSNYLTVPSTSTGFSGDFTVEGWYNITTLSPQLYAILFDARSYPSYDGLLIYQSTTTINVNSNNNATIITGTMPVAVGTWFHMAVSRSGSSIKLFINGVQIGSTATFTTAYTANTAYIGCFNDLYQYTTGFMDDIRITKGYARYTANFTPPTYEDPTGTGTVYDYNYPQVALLLNGDGTNGSTTFTDLSSVQSPVTVVGDTKVNTTTKKYGTGSIYFDGTGDRLQIPRVGIDLRSGDFTYEVWIYPTSTGSCALITTGADLSAYYDWFNIWQVNTNIRLYINGTTGGWNIASAANAAGVTVNAWNHIAFVRYGSKFYLFINGEQKWTTTSSENLNGDTPNTNIFLGGGSGGNYSYAGYMDDIRITKGVARYTQNFTPPTAPLPTSGGY